MNNWFETKEDYNKRGIKRISLSIFWGSMEGMSFWTHCDLSTLGSCPWADVRVPCPVSFQCLKLTFCFQFTLPRRSCHSRIFPLKSCDFFPAELPFSSHFKFHFVLVGKLNVTHPVILQHFLFSFFFPPTRKVQWCETSNLADNKGLIKPWMCDVTHFINKPKLRCHCCYVVFFFFF